MISNEIPNKSWVDENSNKKESIKNKTKGEKIKHNLTELILSSTSHGLPSVFRTERIFFKIMWFIFFLISLSIGLWTIVSSILDFLNYDVVTQVDVIYEIPTQFPTVTFNNLKSQKTNYTLEQILIYCSYDEQPCNVNDFEISDDKLIFKFNSGFNKTQQSIPFKTSSLPGKETGLRIELFIGLPDDDKPYGEFNKYDGLHVVVHNSTVDPRFHDGIDIAPGFATNLIVSRSYTYKLDLPYNDCIIDPTDETAHGSKIFKYMTQSRNYTYRHVDCYDYCLGQEMINICKIDKLESYEYLLDYYALNATLIACFKSVFEEFFNKDVYEICHPHCPLECNTISYGITTSFSKFPNLIYFEKKLKNNSIITSKYPSGYNITYEDILKSTVAFNVYYDDLKYSIITEVPKTGPTDLISNMGGLLGLFIGISFLSFGELAEMLLEVIFILFEKESQTKVSPF